MKWKRLARRRGRPRLSRDLFGRAMRATFAKAQRESRRAVGRAIRRSREDASVSASELAAACGLSVRHLYQLEQGVRDASVARLNQIAAALMIPIEHLLG